MEGRTGPAQRFYRFSNRTAVGAAALRTGLGRRGLVVTLWIDGSGKFARTPEVMGLLLIFRGSSNLRDVADATRALAEARKRGEDSGRKLNRGWVEPIGTVPVP